MSICMIQNSSDPTEVLTLNDHELQSWLEHRIKWTDPIYDLIEDLDDTFGWGARFEYLWSHDRALPRGLLLTGPNGCGKHTAAAHMFRVLNETHSALMLDGRELCADGYPTAAAKLKYVLRHPGSYPWCMILEELEECDCRRKLLTLLGQVLASDPSLFLILIDSHEEDIPSVLRSRLRLCRMSLPTASRRRAFFQKEGFFAIRTSVNLQLLVDSTEGLTYAQLADLAQNLECTLYCIPDDQQPFTDDNLKDFLQEQKPDPAQEDPLRSLAQSARQFLENLPELMTRMGTAVVPAGIVQTPESPDDIVQESVSEMTDHLPDKSDFEKQVNDMPTKDLANDLFGKERMAKLNASRQRV